VEMDWRGTRGSGGGCRFRIGWREDQYFLNVLRARRVSG
jgi:hypothetical protein